MLASKNPSGHSKTVDSKTSGQLKTLEKEQAELLSFEEQRRMETELTKGSSGESASQVDDFESVGSRRNLERATGWANSVA